MAIIQPYFGHDSNARNNKKIKGLINKFGLEAYARFFILLELFLEQQNYSFDLSLEYVVSALTDELRFKNTSETLSFLRELSDNFKLVAIEDNKLYSVGFLERMQKADNYRESRRNNRKHKPNISETYDKDILPNRINEMNIINKYNEIEAKPSNSISAFKNDPHSFNSNLDDLSETELKTYIKSVFPETFILDIMNKFDLLQSDIIKAFKDLHKINFLYKVETKENALIKFARKSKQDRLNQTESTELIKNLSNNLKMKGQSK